MKTTTAVFMALVMLVNASLAISPKQLAETKPIKIEVAPAEFKCPYLKIEVGFDEWQIKNEEVVSALRKNTIKRVLFYYSSYKESETFNQPKLNVKRFELLQKLLPNAFSSSLVQWKIYEQTACTNLEDAQKLFHGFVIEYMDLPTKASVAKEIDEIKMFYKATYKTKEVDSVSYVKRKVTTTSYEWSGKYHPVLKSKRKKNILYTKKTILNRKKQKLPHRDTSFYNAKIETKKTIYIEQPIKTTFKSYTITCEGAIAGKEITSFVTKDTVVTSVLKRNKDWKNMNFVVDVTGSMSPYSTQLLTWYKLNYKKRDVRSIAFFNDGNTLPDNEKIVGKTGGIYFSKNKNVDSIIALSLYAMSMGFGGDAPENNIEAVLHLQKQIPNLKEVFMIADNWADMRDVSLINKIKIPVHVIVCGSYSGLINAQYLNLAYKTGGTVHTLENDLTDLMKLSEGETITIGKFVYVVNKGKIEPLF